MPDYKLKNGATLSEEDLLELAQDNGMTPEEFLEANKDSFENIEGQEDPTLGLNERRYINLPGGKTVYEDNYMSTTAGKTVKYPKTTRQPAREVTFPGTFEEYAAMPGIEQQIQIEDLSLAADVGTITKPEDRISKAKKEAQAASDAVTIDTIPIDQVADKYFGIQFAPKKIIQVQTGGIDGRTMMPQSVVDEDKLEEYLQDKYPLYQQYKETGSFDYKKNVPANILQEIINENKDRSRETVVGRLSKEDQDILTTRVTDIEGSNAPAYEIKRQQAKDEVIYEREYGEELVAPITRDGVYYAPTSLNVLEDERYKKLIGFQKSKYKKDFESVQEILTPEFEEQLNAFEQDQEKYINALNNLTTDTPVEEINALFTEGNRLMELSNLVQEVQYKASKLSKQSENLELTDQEAAALVKDYSATNAIMHKLEEAIIAPGAILGAKGLKWLYNANYLGQNEGTPLWVSQLEKTAIDYNQYLREYGQYKFPLPKISEDNSTTWEYTKDLLIQNSPSIGVQTLLAFGPQMIPVTQGIYFVMEGGGKIAEMEIAQRTAQDSLNYIDGLLSSNDLSNVERARLLSERERYETALNYDEWDKFILGASYGAIAGYAERIGASFLFRNIGRMGRSIGRTRFEKLLGYGRPARVLARTTGVGVAVGSQVGIEQLEETITLLGHNFMDISVLGDNRSLFEGLNKEFFINVGVSTLAIQGGAVGNNVRASLLSESTTSRERRAFAKMRQEIFDLKSQMDDPRTTPEQKRILEDKIKQKQKHVADQYSVSLSTLSILSQEELDELGDINMRLREISREANSLGVQDETGNYGKNRIKELNNQYNDLLNQRDGLLNEAKQREAGLDENTYKNLNPDQQFALGYYTFADNLAKNTKGVKYRRLKGSIAENVAEIEGILANDKNLTQQQKNELISAAIPQIDEQGYLRGVNGVNDYGYAFVFDNVVQGTIANENASQFGRMLAAVSPLHEIGHSFIKVKGVIKNDKLVSNNAERVTTGLINYLQQEKDSNNISEENYGKAIDRLNEYTKRNKGQVDIDELFQLITDLQNTGLLKKSGMANMFGIKNLVNSILKNGFGNNSTLFKIDSVDAALDYIANYRKAVRRGTKIQLPPEEEKLLKKSLSSGNMVPMSESQLAKVKENLDKLGRDNEGVFDKTKFNPENPVILNALPGMIIAQAKKRAIKGLQFDMGELVQETLYQLILRKDIDKFDGTKNDSLYGYLNKFIKWRIGDAFNANPSIVTDFGEASMEDLTTQFSQEEAEDVVTQQEAEVKDVPRTPGLANTISFANRLNKMQPGLINNEVRDNIFKALDKFLNTQEGINGIKLTTRLDWQKSDTNQATDNNGNKLFTNVFGEVITQREREALPANEKEKFEALMNQKLTLQPEEQKDLRAMLNKFLEQELTKYLQKEIIAPPRSPRFKNLVESSFELYKIIPQSFLNDRIESWIQPKLGPDGKQMRETVAEAGEYGGAKGNPIFERKEITKEEWENYWLAPGKAASSQGKLKERFAALIAQEYGKDLLIEFLNDESKLEMFLSQQKLPSVNQLDNLGVQLITALERDPGAFKVKYSLSSEYANVVIANIDDLVKASEKLVRSRKFNKTELEKAFTKVFGNQIPKEAIAGVAKFFRSQYKERRQISYKYKGIKALDEKGRIQSIQEALVYKAFGNFGKVLQFYHNEGGSITSYFKYKDGRTLNDKVYVGKVTNKQHVTNLVQDMLDNNLFTIEEVWQYLGDGLRSGTGSTVFENNQDLYDAFKDDFREAGIILNKKNKFERDGVELSRVNLTQAINGPAMMKAVLQNQSTAYTAYQQNAANARIQLEKIITRLETRIANAETKDDKDAILHSAAVFFVSQSGASNGLLRKIAELTHFETGVNAKNAMFEHMLPANVVVMLIGDILNGKFTKAEFDAIIENGAKGVLTDKNTTEKVVNMFFKNNMPMDVDVRSDNFDAYARYRNSMVAPILQGKTLQGLAGNETIVFAEAPHINSAKQVIESREKQKDRSRKKYSLNTDDIVDFNPLESGLFPDSKTTEWYSDPIKIGPLQDDQAYMMYLSVTQRNDGQPYLMFNFTLYDGEHQHSTALEGNFAGKSINPFRLFGTIGNSVIHFLENNREFEGLEFSGSGNSRIRLYNRLAEMLAKKLGWNLDTEDITIAADDDGNDVEYLAKDYYISKPKAKYSLSSLDKDFNLIIEDKFGIEEYKRFSQVVGKRRGAKIDKFNLKNWWFPPSAEDFMGLMYDVLAKGTKGDAQKQWIVDNLVIPYTHGIAQIDKARQSIKRTYRNLLAENKGITKLLQQKIEDGDYTFDQAIRVYMWNKQGDEIAGLSERDRNKLVAIVEGSQELKDFISVLMSLPNLSKGWPKPSEYWDAQTILSDLNNLTEKTNRKEFLAQFIENADVVFSEQNMNKLRAAVGNNWVEAMEDILYRMKNGTNRPSGSNRIVNAWNNWVNRSIGAIMFFNRRSAVLQTLSTVNFINWSDNNPIKAAAAFANQKQYWKDFAYIFNSDKLKERRGGLRTDVSEAEIANQADLSKGDPGAILSYLLKIGFSLTQIADSFAIASGGATFYRNRINTYVKEGLTQKEAEEKAWSDFSRISDETQQSSDPMLISQEQASVLGRLVLAFQNTSAQYTRRGRKGIRDLITGRGDFKTNLSVSIYYLAVQNVLFNALQNALFTFIPGFDDEPEDETLTEAELERKQQKDAATWARAINGSLDTILRGMGVRGAAIATLKNTIMKYYEQEEKDPFFKDNAQVVLEALNISPPIGSKARKLYNGLRTRDFEKDVIEERGFDLFIDGKFKPSPIYSVIGNIAAAAANIPLDRVYDETVAIAEAFDSRNSEWQRLALGLGYKTWTVGAKFEEEDLIKERAAALRKAAGIEKAKETRKKNKRKADSLEVIKRYNETKDLTADEYIEYVRMELLKKKKK
jgi:hypothetical protein